MMINFVLQALDGIFTIVFVVGIGYVLSKKGWFDDKSSALIAKLVTTVSLPLYMITSLTKILRQKSWSSWHLICCCPYALCFWH